jgi:hypothetical protein
MKIGINYICTWKYDVFWKDFYCSTEKYFLKNHEIHYFVFTDSESIYDSITNNRIHIISHQHLWRPDATLMRFHTFLSAKEQLEKMDYLFFCNANLEIKKEIYDEILPSDKEGIVVTQHPWFYKRKNTQFTYERNPHSTAHIKKWEWKVYVQGALNWWKTRDFLYMCDILAKNIDQDTKKGIVAIWHDESHLNKYILDHPYKLLDPSYLYPEWWDIPFECKILIRNKSKYIPINDIKWYSTNVFTKLFWYIKKILCWL